MKDVDMIVEQAITKETAFVQVKSASNQRELDHYVKIYEQHGGSAFMIYACHSPVGPLTSDRPDVLVWTRATLADQILRNGLMDWLMARVA